MDNKFGWAFGNDAEKETETDDSADPSTEKGQDEAAALHEAFRNFGAEMQKAIDDANFKGAVAMLQRSQTALAESQAMLITMVADAFAPQGEQA